ncbi:hypothetical protein KKA85_09125 [bacterium]|nr:hypothetical protein [bacterium]MBU1675927.1 hypothetical protein [bacterium]
MTRPLKITKEVHFRSMKRGRKELRVGAEEVQPTLGSVPRVSRLLALALHMDDLCRLGEVADYAELARLALVTRARMTQIMSLLLLAPDIQEEILYLPRSDGGRDPIREKAVRPIATVPDWRKQRVMWRDLKAGLPD